MADNPVTSADGAATEAVAKLHLDEVTNEMVSKSELKKRQKTREREAAKEKKNAGKPQQPAGQSRANAEAAEKELTPNQVGRGCPARRGASESARC